MTPPSSASPPSSSTATPAMRQYLDAKRQHQDAIVFFRMGDFYEMFYEDALTASRALEITLTSRSKDANGQGIPMCGVPHHAADGYIARLVKKGFRVAICEQVEDPKKTKGLVRREVVRVVSPGTFTDAGYLDEREPAFLVSIAPAPIRRTPGAAGDAVSSVGVALLDLSTGEFATAEYDGTTGLRALADELAVLRPREVVVPSDLDLAALEHSLSRADLRVTSVEPWTFDQGSCERLLTEQLQTQTLTGFGLDGRPAAVAAAGGLLQYARDTQKVDLAHVRTLSLRATTDHLVLDRTTLRHLELVEGADGGRAGSLLHEIDATVTAMGGRLLRAWLLRPLVSLEPVLDRLDAVEELAFRSADRAKLRDRLGAIRDLERLLARAALGSGGPRDVAGLGASIAGIPRVRAALADCRAPLTVSLLAALDDLVDVRDDVEATLVDDPPALARDGGAIRDGVDSELDELRGISRSGKEHIASMEASERTRTGIGSLKIRYNRVFGYFIEVSKANLDAVPDDYLRKQTTAGAERYVTPALKDYEEKVLGADERIVQRENELFEALRGRVAAQAERIQTSARSLATLDVLAGLAESAAANDYIKPQVHDGDELDVSDARHPVVERHCPDRFVPNDVRLNATTHQLVILTGPNMGGKSTYLRQTALLCVLAQIGSFVPAREAKIPVVDRIFARVGASDDIARGQSTFMVEMQETANILHGATHRSLVLLDEIGRGTATFDGLSIAWAVAEHLATGDARPKTIFATHYHELTDLADSHEGIVNFHALAREWHDDIVFLRKVEPGRSDRSYGVQVARLAGLPPAVVSRARAILQSLERDELWRGGRPALSDPSGPPPDTGQLGLFQSGSPEARVVERLRETDIEHLTPLEALTRLSELKQELDS